MFFFFRKKLTDNELDAHLKSDPICARQEFCNDIVRHPASLEKPDTGRPIVYSGFPYDNENHVSPVNGSVIVNENQQSMFASVDVDFAKHFRRSNKPSVLELKVIAFVLSDHNPSCTRTVVARDLCTQFLYLHRK
jgi:hypothetical protein